MLDLAHRMNGTELMRVNPNDFTGGTSFPKNGFHVIAGLIQVCLSTDENEVRLARKHVHHMRDDGLPLKFDQGLGHGVASSPKALTKSRHWNNNLHRSTLMFANSLNWTRSGGRRSKSASSLVRPGRRS